MPSTLSPLVESSALLDLPDGPVPGNAQSGVCGVGSREPHEVERAVQRALLTLPDITFSSLQVHRCERGICLTGVVNVPDYATNPPIERVARMASGVQLILNQLVVKTREIA